MTLAGFELITLIYFYKLSAGSAQLPLGKR
jgi:hypothetical protein